jgi:tyrosyl-tRNA synthetase
MSKSLNNYIGIHEPPNEMFGKLMSVSDDLMWRYIELLSFEPIATVEGWKTDVAGGRNPRDIKVTFAQEVVARFHNRAAAEKALADFEARFKQGALPDEMPEVTVPAGGIAQVLKQAGLTASTSEALRMIDQGGVKVNGDKVSDKALALSSGQQLVIQVGKRKFARVTLT